MKELIDCVWNMNMWTFIGYIFVVFGILSDYSSEIIGSLFHRSEKNQKS